MKITFSWMITCLSIVLAGCVSAGVSAGGSAKSEVLLEVEGLNSGSIQTMPAVASVNGSPAVLYATIDNRIVFQRGDQKLFLDTDAPVKGGNRFQLNAGRDRMYAQWWSHEKAKNLYFTSTTDAGTTFSPVSIVNDAHGILSPITFLQHSNGAIGMTYHDERAPRFQAYFNRSTDNGLTWGRPDQRLDSPSADGSSSYVTEPQSVEAENAWVTAWVDSITVLGKTTNRILATKSDDAGLSWSAPQVLFESEQHIASLNIKASGSLVVVAADENERGIVAFVSNDKASNWRSAGVLDGTAAPVGSSGASISGLRMALSEGSAHLVWMAEYKGIKTRIMRGRLNLTDVRWQAGAERLDVKQYENSQSTLPTILSTKGGALVAAWVDYRHIRPTIYISSSVDKGQSWADPRPLEQPGMLSLGLPSLMQWGNDAAIAYQSYPSDRIQEGKFILRLLPVTASGVVTPKLASSTPLDDAARKERLVQRVKEFWQSRIKDDYKVSYGMFDFAYRAQVSEKQYLASVGVMTFLAFEQPDVEINGNEATVKAKVRYEVPENTLPNGKKIKLDATDADTVSTWVWIGDNWYFVFKPSPGEPTLKY